jgi:hypothetical protein
MNANYEVVYNVGLLDDLHNYFPALLYEHNRFQSLANVFHYVRHQMNQRFNLYSYGARLASAQPTTRPEVEIPTVILTPQMRPMATTVRPVTPIVPATPVTPAPQPRTAPLRAQATTDELITNLQAANLLLGLLGTGADLTPPARGGMIRQTPAAELWAQFRQPVVVRPSVEVIASATERLVGNDLPAGTVCTICQDTIVGDAPARRLRVCQHSYHEGCIDQWFERSVFCPTCRHDIRE